MRESADWPSIHQLPHDFAEREVSHTYAMRARLEIAVLIAERSYSKHDYNARQSRALAQVRTIDAHLAAMTASSPQARFAATDKPTPITQHSIDLLRDALDELHVIVQDNAGDFAAEDRRMAAQICKLEADISAWVQRLN